MPKRKEHNKIARSLRGILFNDTVSDKKIDSVNRWMDNPANKSGQYNIKKTGQPISPDTHRFIRHNSIRVAKALSGTGEIDPDIEKIAAIHILADIGFNRIEILKILEINNAGITYDKLSNGEERAQTTSSGRFTRIYTKTFCKICYEEIPYGISPIGLEIRPNKYLTVCRKCFELHRYNVTYLKQFIGKEDLHGIVDFEPKR